MTVLWAVFGFIVAISILVTVHEWGHYAMARFFNIRVTHFSIGFGPVLTHWQGRETRFQLCALPLGGYVRFADERVEPVPPAQSHRAFNRQSVFKRFCVVAAGPAINLLFAWAVFAVMFASGVSGLKPVFQWTPQTQTQTVAHKEPAWLLTQVGSTPVATWQQARQALLGAVVDKDDAVTLTYRAFDPMQGLDARLHQQQVSLSQLSVDQAQQGLFQSLGMQPKGPEVSPVIDQVVSGSPADVGGLQAGDRIVALNQQPIPTWQALQQFVQSHPAAEVTLTLERAGVRHVEALTLGQKTHARQTVGFLGASAQMDPSQLKPFQTTVQAGPLEALKMGGAHTWEWMGMTLTMIQRMLSAQVSWDHLSGPLRIAQFSGQAMQSGWTTFLGLLGLLILSLGLLNLLPIPVLDGGHLVFYLVEMIKGSPVSETVELFAQKIGLFLIISLSVFAIFNDVVRLSHG